MSQEPQVSDKVPALNSRQQDQAIEELRTEIIKLQSDIEETRKDLNRYKHRKPATNPFSDFVPMCTLKEGHSGDCQFE